MRVEIKCTDGEIYSTPEISVEDMQAEMDADWDGKGFRPSAEDTIEDIKDVVKHVKELDNFSITVGKVTRYFNPDHIVWGVVYD